MRELIEWIYKADQETEYGVIVLTITKHQGEIVSVEKQIIKKEKYDKKKKLDI